MDGLAAAAAGGPASARAAPAASVVVSSPPDSGAGGGSSRDHTTDRRSSRSRSRRSCRARQHMCARPARRPRTKTARRNSSRTAIAWTRPGGCHVIVTAQNPRRQSGARGADEGPTKSPATAVSGPRREHHSQDGQHEEELADHAALRSPEAARRGGSLAGPPLRAPNGSAERHESCPAGGQPRKVRPMLFFTPDHSPHGRDRPAPRMHQMARCLSRTSARRSRGT